jgi:hypothetical protein
MPVLLHSFPQHCLLLSHWIIRYSLHLQEFYYIPWIPVSSENVFATQLMIFTFWETACLRIRVKVTYMEMLAENKWNVEIPNITHFWAWRPQKKLQLEEENTGQYAECSFATRMKYNVRTFYRICQLVSISKDWACSLLCLAQPVLDSFHYLKLEFFKKNFLLSHVLLSRCYTITKIDERWVGF